jgi:hypothetical protein
MVREVTIALEQPAEGAFSGRLRITTSGRETIIPVDAEVAPGRPVKAPVAAVRGRVEPSPAKPVPAPVLAARVKKITPTTCEIEWPAAPRELQYKIATFPISGTSQSPASARGSLLPDVTIQRSGGDVGKNLAAHGVKIDEWGESAGCCPARRVDQATQARLAL